VQKAARIQAWIGTQKITRTQERFGIFYKSLREWPGSVPALNKCTPNHSLVNSTANRSGFVLALKMLNLLFFFPLNYPGGSAALFLRSHPRSLDLKQHSRALTA
jgi:hypothetical protein